MLVVSEYKKLNIKDWAVEDRPREKLQTNGSRALSDAELIAILIGSGNVEESAVELSRRILKSANNNIAELSKMGIDELTAFNGIGEAKAINILAALELGKRRKDADVFIKEKITSSKDVADVFTPLLSDLPHEEFWILLLNRGNKIIEKQRISQGGIAGTVIDVKMILKPAIDKLASSIILCHNHPSGTLSASDADLQITRKINEAAKTMDLSVLDHIIIGNDSYISLADEGLLVQ